MSLFVCVCTFVCVCVALALRDPMAMERANLLNMAKLSIKGLIESALSFGRTLDSDYPPLQQFFVVMEHCLKHGLKGTCINMTNTTFNIVIFIPSSHKSHKTIA